MTEAVEQRLRGQPATADKPWMKSFGKLKHMHEENVRIQKIIEQEFEQIDLEDWD